jgi:predicted permease
MHRLFPAGTFVARGFSRLTEAQVDLVVLSFALGATVASMLISSLYPSVKLSKLELQDGLKDGGYFMAGSSGGNLARDILTAAQVAISLLLLVGAGLLFRSYQGLVNVDLGFQTSHRIAAQSILSQKRYPTGEAKTRYLQETMDRLRQIPGALEVAATSNLTFSNLTTTVGSFGVEGRPIGQERKDLWPLMGRPWACLYAVSPTFFDVQGITILKGRAFEPGDTAQSEPVLIIDHKLESILFPEGGSLGQRLDFGKELFTIVGIAAAVRKDGPLQEHNPTIYMPYHQQPMNRISWVVKTAVAPELLSRQLQDALESIDPEQPIYGVETLDNYFRQSILRNRLNSLLMSFFGLSALILACLGLYGVLAFQVARRTHEVGVRKALGAGQWDIFGMVVRRGMLLLIVGLLLGNLAAFGLTRFLSSMLFGVGTLDTATFIVVGIVFLSVGFVACSLPALRAVRLDPSRALRYE